MVRTFLKTIVETGALATGVEVWGPGRRAGATLILAYHNIVSDAAAFARDDSLHLSLSTFQRQLDALRRSCDVVSLEDGSNAEGTRPRAVITFDDAYRGAVRLAIPELAARGLPATMFVAPGYIPDGTFWWDALRTPAGAAMTEADRVRALTELGGSEAAIRDWAAERGYTAVAVPADERAASEADLGEALARHAGLTFGSHAWSHPNLAALPPQDISRELESSLAWLRERFDRVVPWLAYPYGIDSPAVAAAAAAAGYHGAVRVTGGHFVGRPQDLFRVPRLNVPAGLSLRGFRLRLSGVLSR
jgi:peptidoglycan/xylan/chitin deacetylase (PgdA/CDA1 family)